LLNLCDVWPDVPILGYFEFFYRIDGTDVGFDPEFPTPVTDYARIRAKNAVNLLALSLGQHGQTPTRWQHSTYPQWSQRLITLLPEGAKLDVCKPNPRARRRSLTIGDMTIKPTDKLVTYVSRDLEPYRGFHTMMRAVPHLLRARKDIRVVMVGADGISYGTPPAKGNWRETMLAELGDSIDPDRVAFPGRIEYKTYVAMLQRSDVHVYLSYPFVASWSLREALATGCFVVGTIHSRCKSSSRTRIMACWYRSWTRKPLRTQ
jgi:glycosyltransferase involved in cell wall biosynthesis